uniref:C-type lectin domain-containing protein n=1 Tax=Strongyloides papillosus TaxID=174720 RepID=A0A0N5B9X6_STREA
MILIVSIIFIFLITLINGTFYECSHFKGNFPAEIRCLRQKLTLCEKNFNVTFNSYNNGKNKNIPNTSCCTKVKEELEYSVDERIENIENKFKDKIDSLIETYEHKLKLLSIKIENDHIENERYIKLMTKKIHYFNSSEYIFVEDKVSWYAAEHSCSKWNGHLVSFISEEESDFIRKIHKTVIWTGLNDIQNEGDFVYSDNAKPKFIIWKKGAPDNKEHNENCVEQDSSGRLNDIFCFMARPYICKR